MVGKSGDRTTDLCSCDTRVGSQQRIAGSDGRCDEGAGATERDQRRPRASPSWAVFRFKSRDILRSMRRRCEKPDLRNDVRLQASTASRGPLTLSLLLCAVVFMAGLIVFRRKRRPSCALGHAVRRQPLCLCASPNSAQPFGMERKLDARLDGGHGLSTVSRFLLLPTPLRLAGSLRRHGAI